MTVAELGLAGRRRWLGRLAIVVLTLALRSAIAATYSSSSGDGDQYLSIATQLARNHRFAFSETPKQLTWVRPPLFPIVLATLRPDAHEPAATVARVAFLNAFLDAGTALGIALTVYLLGFGLMVELVAISIFAASPLSFLFTSYVLTESLATCLSTWALLAALYAREKPLGLVIAGGLAGLCFICRADTVTLLPALVLLVATRAPRPRLASTLVLLVCAGLAPAAWSARNLVRFGHAHPLGAEWTESYGTPLSSCLPRWFRTWATGRPEDGQLASAIFGEEHLKLQYVTPAMADSPEEMARVRSLVRQLEIEPPESPFEEFCSLATERRQRDPIRYYLQLPGRRIAALFTLPRQESYPQPIPWLRAPRAVWSLLNTLLWLLAAAGLFAAMLTRSVPGSTWVSIALVFIARIALHAFAVPHFVSGRFIVELVPLAALLAAVALAAISAHIYPQQADAGATARSGS